jgi:hypothetical protein
VASVAAERVAVLVTEVGDHAAATERASQRSRQTTSAVIDAFLPSHYSSLILRFANGEVVSRAPL